MDTQIDPRAVNIAKAIRQQESGGDYTLPGKSGEYGGYQFTEPTWDAYAKEAGVNVPLKQATREQQNEVAVKKINDWITTGKAKNVGEVASMWNAGEGKPQAYLENNVGTNKYGVHYDTPAYAKAVAEYYQQYKGSSGDDKTNQPGTPNADGFVTTADIPSVSTEKQKEQRIAQGEPVSLQPDRVKPTLGGSLIRGVLKTPAKVATSLVQAGEVATGHKLTQPFTGSYLGKVEPLGGGLEGDTKRMIGEGIKAGLEAGSYLIGGEGKNLVGGLLKNSSALESSAVETALKKFDLPMSQFKTLSAGDKLEYLTQSLRKAGAADRLVIQQAIDKVTPLAVKEAGGKVAFSKLNPGMAKILGLGGKALKYGGGMLLAGAGLNEGKKVLNGLLSK